MNKDVLTRFIKSTILVERLNPLNGETTIVILTTRFISGDKSFWVNVKLG